MFVGTTTNRPMASSPTGLIEAMGVIEAMPGIEAMRGGLVSQKRAQEIPQEPVVIHHEDFGWY